MEVFSFEIDKAITWVGCIFLMNVAKKVNLCKIIIYCQPYCMLARHSRKLYKMHKYVRSCITIFRSPMLFNGPREEDSDVHVSTSKILKFLWFENDS